MLSDEEKKWTQVKDTGCERGCDGHWFSSFNFVTDFPFWWQVSA